jgi:hypothetical protein
MMIIILGQAQEVAARDEKEMDLRHDIVKSKDCWSIFIYEKSIYLEIVVVLEVVDQVVAEIIRIVVHDLDRVDHLDLKDDDHVQKHDHDLVLVDKTISFLTLLIFLFVYLT